MKSDTERWAKATRRHLEVMGKTGGQLAEMARLPGSFVSGLISGQLQNPLSRHQKEDLFKAVAAGGRYYRRGRDFGDLSHLSDDELLGIYELTPQPEELGRNY
ncbi:MAG: hypothetical protein HY676_00310 [Chloroflexi bacterium]|nr:hypothetical protein [Chloroflexota bacterium]